MVMMWVLFALNAIYFTSMGIVIGITIAKIIIEREEQDGK